MGRSVRPSLLLACLGALLLLASGAGAAAKKRPSTTKPAATVVRRADTEPESIDLPPTMRQPVPEIPPDLKELPLTAKGEIVIDALTGATLYEKNADEAQYPASTTKILTALLVIEEGNLDHEIEVTDDDSKVPESGLNIRPGDHFTRREALYGLLLKSANDVAHALGRDNAGTIEAFAAKMNIRAAELGACSCHFANPHGLQDVQHYVSPRDLVTIARAAMQQPLFRQIVSTQYYTWTAHPEPLPLRNHNHLLWWFPGCTGVKTGYTYPAQQVLVSAAQWGDREVIAAVMHAGKPGIWDDSKLLLTYGLEHEKPLPP